MIWIKLHVLLGTSVALLGMAGLAGSLFVLLTRGTPDPSAAGIALFIFWSLAAVGTVLLRQAELLQELDPQRAAASGTLHRGVELATAALLVLTVLAGFPLTVIPAGLALAGGSYIRRRGGVPPLVGRAAGAIATAVAALLTIVMLGSALVSIPGVLREPYPALVLGVGIVSTPLLLTPVFGLLLVGRACWILSSRRT